jgi:hypothetical protein
MMEKKNQQIREFQKENALIGRFLTFFFAGTADLWRGNGLKGLLLLFLLFTLILRLVYAQGVIQAPGLQSSSWVYWRIGAWGIVFLLFYLFSLKRVYRFKPRYETQANGSSRSISRNA